MSDKTPRLLLVYNRNPVTTASYLEAALRRRAHVVTVGHEQEVHVPRGAPIHVPELLEQLGAEFDAVLEVEGDNVVASGYEAAKIPCAFWAIDSHLHMTYDHHFFRAGSFDHNNDVAPAPNRSQGQEIGRGEATAEGVTRWALAS